MCTVHLHYTKDSRTATKAELSFTGRGWDVCMIEGYTPSNYPPIDYPLLPNGRTHSLMKDKPEVFPTKIAILNNHLRFWKTVVETGKTQIYAEHDFVCKKMKFDLPKFEDVLVLHCDNKTLPNLLHYHMGIPEFDSYRFNLQNGIHSYEKGWPWEYRYKTIYEGAMMAPTAMCYALTPKGAEKILNAIEKNGIEQGDMMLNDKVVNLKFLIPSIGDFYPPLTKSLGNV